MAGFAEPRLTEASKPTGALVGEESFVIGARHWWPAGVLAWEESHRRRVVQEQVPHRVDYVFLPFWPSSRYGSAQSEARPPSAPPGVPQNVSSAFWSGCFHYNGYYYDGNGQPVGPNQLPVDCEFSSVRDGPRTGFGGPRLEVSNMLVQTRPPPDPPRKGPHNIKQKRGEQKEQGNVGPFW